MAKLARLGAAKLKARKLRQLAAASGVAPSAPSNDMLSAERRTSSLTSISRGSWHRLTDLGISKSGGDSETGSEQLGYDESPEAKELAEALAVEDVEKVEEILEKGMNVNVRFLTDQDPGQTPIMRAIRFGCFECAERLLSAGADPYIPDDKFRDAWYYACFSRTINNGDHQVFMGLLLSYWELEADVLLMAMHSSHSGVRREAMETIPITIESRDSKDVCTIRFSKLGMMDSSEAIFRWPDGSRSKPGATPFEQMVQLEAVESLSHPAGMAMLEWKWKSFGRLWLVLDLIGYLCTLLSTSAAGLLGHEHHTMTGEGGTLSLVHIVNLVIVSMMFLEEIALATTTCIKSHTLWPLTGGRFLHAFLNASLVIASDILYVAGCYRASADVLAGAVLVTWLRLLYFARLSKGIGAFCITLVEMIRRDVTKFLLFLAAVLPGFAIAMRLLVMAHCRDIDDNAQVDQYDLWDGTMTNLMFLFLGLHSWDGLHIDCIDHPTINLCALLFLLLTMIVLLNLLIAMFSDTYKRIQGMSVHTWALNLAQYMIQKEYLMAWLGVSNTRFSISSSNEADVFVVHGKYQDFFLPKLAIDGDERVEDRILGQLEDLALEFKRKNDEVAQRLKRIERSLMTDKLKAAASKALSSGFAKAARLKGGNSKKSKRTLKIPEPAAAMVAWQPGKREDAVRDSETHEESKRSMVLSFLGTPQQDESASNE